MSVTAPCDQTVFGRDPGIGLARCGTTGWPPRCCRDACRRGSRDPTDHHRPHHPAGGARQGRDPARRAGERAARLPAGAGAARLRAVLRGAPRRGDAAAHRPRLRRLPGRPPPRLGAGARRALRRHPAAGGAGAAAALLRPLRLRGPPPPLLVHGRARLRRRPQGAGAAAEHPRRAGAGQRVAGQAHPLGPQGGARPHGGHQRPDRPPGLRAPRRLLPPAAARGAGAGCARRRRGWWSSRWTRWSRSAPRCWSSASTSRPSTARPTGSAPTRWGWSTRPGGSPSSTGRCGSSTPPAPRPHRFAPGATTSTTSPSGSSRGPTPSSPS